MAKPRRNALLYRLSRPILVCLVAFVAEGHVGAQDEDRPIYKTKYRVIDVHTHCFAPGIDAIKAQLEVIDGMGVSAIVVLDGGDTDGNLIAWMHLRKKFPERLIVFGNVPWAKIKQDIFFQDLPREITEQHRLGV